MSHRLIRVSSCALGFKRTVRVYVYDTVDELRTAADEFNTQSGANEDTLGVTQAWTYKDQRAKTVIVRLARGHLGTQVVSHELHHAATAIYGAAVDDSVSRVDHLNHFNEPFAHLYSDLLARLVDRLYALSYLPELAGGNMPGKKMKSIKNRKAYEKLKSLGFSKSSAAAISNASAGGKSKGGKGKGKGKKK